MQKNEIINNCVEDWEVVFKSVHDLIIILDTDNRILDANPAVFKATGLREDQVIGHLCYTIFHCTENVPCDCPYEKLKKSLHQESITMEMEALGRKYLVTVAPIFDDENGRMTRVVHIAKDITELIKAETACHYSEKKFEGIFQAVSDGILVAGVADKKLFGANTAICEMLGYTRDEILQLKVYDIHPKNDLPQVMEAFEKQGRQDIPVKSELPVIRKDGSVFYADISSRAVTLGEEKFIVGVFRDITDRKNVEERLIINKKILSKAQEIAHIGSWYFDIRKNILSWSDEEYRIFGLTPQEFGATYEAFLDTIHPDDREMVDRTYTEAIRNKIPYECVHRVIRPDGTERVVHEKSEDIVDESGETIYSYGMTHDITEQKLAEENKVKLEQQIQKNKRLESLGILAGGIAHDFNNILAAILGNINLVLFDESLDETAKKLLSEAERASLRAKDLTQQLLTFSRGGAPVKETTFLETVIKESASFVLHGKNVACQYNIPEDLWFVDIDKGQISQVIQNIVINAGHAMPEGGTVIISCENVSSVGKNLLPNWSDGKYIKITIQDNGIGIPEKLFDKIFDPYFSTKQEGSGLGLAICQSIISKHNGEIFVESFPGDGTIFTIYLPASDKIKPLTETTVQEYKISSPAKILIMDDEELVRNVAKAMLRKFGNEVVLSVDGAEAARLYQEAMSTDNPIQLVIMDLTVPGGMGGKDAVQEIHKLNPEAKVVVSSGYSNDPIMANFRKYGFCGAIVKPFKIQELYRLISRVLG